jgi:transcriptional regulator with XRE-family HTH domain
MPLDLGERLRSIREEKSISLSQLAEKTGYTKSFISQVEKNRTSPSISSLLRITDALGINPQEILHRGGTSEKILVKKSERDLYFHKKSKAQFEFLFTKNPKRKMEPLFVTIEAGGCSDAYSHDGEEFGTVLKGSLELTVGDETFLMEEGDSVYFNSQVKHHWKNNGSTKTIALWITTPPSF